MKQLDIVFTKSKKRLPLGSWLIRFWTGKDYSHVAVQQEIREWGKRYFQASEGKVNYEFERFFEAKHEIVKIYTIEVSKDLDRSIKHACYVEAGNKYAMLQNLGIALIDITFRLFGKKFKNPWNKGRNCSEILYTAVFMQMLGALDYSENTIKPQHIEEIILNNFVQRPDGTWIRK